MKKYSDYSDGEERDLTAEELKNVKWTNYKIIVPTEEDKDAVMEAFQHFHYEGYDSDFIVANQLAHEYLEGSNIIVDPDYFKE